jgi:small subunit ribosomal protein S6
MFFVLPFCSVGPAVAQLRGRQLTGQSQREEGSLRETTRVPRSYELMIIIAPDVTEDELPGVIDRVGGYITGAEGDITGTLRESPWGRRRLAYAIRHSGRDVRDGFYTVYHFDAPPTAIADIERELRLTDQVMRFLVTHFTPQPITEQVAESTEGVEGQQTDGVEPESAAGAPAVETVEAEVPTADVAEVEAPAEEVFEAEAPVEQELVPEIAEPEKVPEAEPEAEVVEAPAKKPATRRKKAVAKEEVEAEAETSDE